MLGVANRPLLTNARVPWAFHASGGRRHSDIITKDVPGASQTQATHLARGLRGCRLVDQANEMFRVLPIALTHDCICAARAFR